MGVGFDSMSKDEAVRYALDIMEKRRGGYMVTPNPEIVMESWKTPELKTAVTDADLVIPDGVGIIHAANILKTPLKERLPGIDVTTSILECMARDGKSVFLLGAKPGVAEKAAEAMEKQFPGLVICGTQDGYFKDDAPVIEMINEAKPDFLLVCLGAPKQEIWMARNAGKLNVGFMGGLGGTLDVFAGVTKRAPKIWQDLGLEWLYRCVKEPWRFKRAAKLPKFMLKAIGKRLRTIFKWTKKES